MNWELVWCETPRWNNKWIRSLTNIDSDLHSIGGNVTKLFTLNSSGTCSPSRFWTPVQNSAQKGVTFVSLSVIGQRAMTTITIVLARNHWPRDRPHARGGTNKYMLWARDDTSMRLRLGLTITNMLCFLTYRCTIMSLKCHHSTLLHPDLICKSRPDFQEIEERHFTYVRRRSACKIEPANDSP